MNKTGKRLRHLRAGAAGFSLIETVIAIAVVAVTFIGIIGLLGVGVSTDQTSSQQTVATNIIASIMADLRSTPGNVPTGGNYAMAPSSTRYGVPLPSTDTLSATPLVNVQPVTLYFDNSQNYIQTGGSLPPSAAYKASVYLVQLSHVGNGPNGAGKSQYSDMCRLVVSWPAQAPAGSAETVDVVSQFLLH